MPDRRTGMGLRNGHAIAFAGVACRKSVGDRFSDGVMVVVMMMMVVMMMV